MTIRYIDKIKNIAGDRGILLLEELFEISRDSVEGIDADRFRADHYDDLGLFDELTNKGFLTDKWNETKLYRPTVYALPLLKNLRSSEILEQANLVIDYLRLRYIEKLGETIEIAEVAYDLSKDYLDITETFLFMRDGHSWFCGCSIPFPFGENFPTGDSATLTTCENLLKNESFDEIINKYFEWHFLGDKKRSLTSTVLAGTDIKPSFFGVSIDLKKIFGALSKK